ncbi:FAD-dependent monooxygenase [Sulfuricystis multivorans]|uniref:FAD-dependent monooxygenase n=1 Tax=Sulfuricystis multivorans TaxID=2211108 RepID=UPI000F840C1F|nr:FAD-dependent monooxygenase [Sulfuricystis multivorans]
MNAPVLIIGGGPAGMALALALWRNGVMSRIVDIRPRGAAKLDARILALSHGARLILEALGVWQDIPHTPIETIHVSHAGGLGRTLISADEEGVPALGYVLSAGALATALDAAISRVGIDYAEKTPAPATTDALLTVHAEGRIDDGADLVVRDYGQHAVICLAKGVASHGHIAWERFTPEGPVALLPFNPDRPLGREAIPRRGRGDLRPRDESIAVTIGEERGREGPARRPETPAQSRMTRFAHAHPLTGRSNGQSGFNDGYAVVLTCPAADSERIAALGDADFLALLQMRFGSRLALAGVGPRQVYPLGLRMRRQVIAERAVWIGNAAQTLHPVAGQGFNLALRDIAELADTLRDAADPGDPELLSRYARGRRLDRLATATFTGTLVRLFSNDFGPLKHLRGAGLLALDLCPPARSFLARRMMFGARGW